MTPLEFMIYFISLPVLLAGLYTAWVVTRADRNPPRD
jgi:hypothetical protein